MEASAMTNLPSNGTRYGLSICIVWVIGAVSERKTQSFYILYDLAASSALRISFLVMRAPSIGSIPPPSNSIEMTPEKSES